MNDSPDKSLKTVNRQWLAENEAAFQAFAEGGLQADCPVYPPNIVVEPVNACNLDCPFCATDFQSRPRKMMSLGLFTRLIEDLRNHGLFPRLTIAGEGEPLLNKSIVEMVGVAKQAGMAPWMITNGTLLDRTKVAGLLRAGIDRIQVSIDAVDPELYAKLRRAKGNRLTYFPQTMGNILELLRQNAALGFPTTVSISSVQTSLNAHHREKFLEFWSQLPVDNVFLAPFSTLQANSPLPEAEGHFYTGPMKDKPVCVVPFVNAKVNSDGSVNLCTHDYNGVYSIGSIAEASFTELWNNDRAIKLRQALLNAEVEEFVAMGHDCRRCNNPINDAGLPRYLAGSEARCRRLTQDKPPIQDLDAKLEALGRLALEFPPAEGDGK